MSTQKGRRPPVCRREPPPRAASPGHVKSMGLLSVASCRESRRAWGSLSKASCIVAPMEPDLVRTERALPSRVAGRQPVGARTAGGLAIGALAFGALAIGAVAIGRLAINRLRVDRAELRSLKIDDLQVERLRVHTLTVLDQPKGGRRDA